MKQTSPLIVLFASALALLIPATPVVSAQSLATISKAQSPVAAPDEVVHGSLSEIRFRPFVFLRIRDSETLRAVERVIRLDTFGQLISVGAPADADFHIGFISNPKTEAAKVGFTLPDPTLVTSDYHGQMVVYTKNSRGQMRILWVDQNGANRPERGMFDFLRALAQDKESSRHLPLPMLMAQITANEPDVLPLNGSTKPIILNKERAKFLEEARTNKVTGSVTLSVIYNADGELSDLLVIKGLPHGMTASCIEALKKMRFTPATKDGKPVNVRSYVEFSFNLY